MLCVWNSREFQALWPFLLIFCLWNMGCDSRSSEVIGKPPFDTKRFLDQPASPRAMQITFLLLTCSFQLLFSFGDKFQLTLYVLNLWQVDSRTWEFLSSWEMFLVSLLLCRSRNTLHKRIPVTLLPQQQPLEHERSSVIGETGKDVFILHAISMEIEGKWGRRAGRHRLFCWLLSKMFSKHSEKKY